MGASSLRFRIYSASLVVAAAGGTWLSWRLSPPVWGWLLLALAAACILSEVLAVNLPSGDSISLTYPLVVSVLVLFGPTAGAVAAAFSNAPYLVRPRGSSPMRLAFNLGQITLSTLLAGWAYVVLGGRLLSNGALTVGDFPRLLVPLLATPLLCMLLNFALGFVGHSMIHDIPLARVVASALDWMVAPQVALGLLGITIAQVLAIERIAGLALFAIPLVVARQMHSRFLSLRETYAETVRSLVAAIEAKDPYTKGHSVRVAELTTELAQAMGLGDEQIERLEIAALLHDLGKIGIRRSVLAKPERLTDEEYSVVKQHPDIGARILESVPFLSDVVPIVQGHHERFDGGGYGQALRGEHIPIGARILAVADSYDAMTTERPYRPALSGEVARAELVRGRGTQFDGDVVDAFLGTLGDVVAEAPLTQSTSAAEEVPYA